MAYPFSAGGREVTPRTKTLFETRGGALFEVAHALSKRHVNVARLKGEGYTLKEIADEMNVSPNMVSQLLIELKIHLKHFLLTGKKPGNQTTTLTDRLKADGIVETHFAAMGRKRRVVHAIALGLVGKLPRRLDGIYILKRAVEKAPDAFPEEIKKTLNKRKTIADEIAPLREKLQIAADRGDETAKRLLSPKPIGGASRVIQTLKEGKGLAARHPDLFLGTQYAPKAIRGINVHALRTRKSAINGLARRREVVGIAMNKFLKGKSLARIAKDLGMKPKSVGRLMNHGVHVVFGIEPQGSRAAKLYNEIRRKHAGLFT